MSTTKWTPGPWHVSGEDEGDGMQHLHIGASGSWMTIASMNEVHTDTRANANLIAAATELYEALEELLAHASFPAVEMQLDAADPFPAHAAVINARAALAKARGEA